MFLTFYVFTVGPAGSGKSSLVAALDGWLNEQEIDVATVNLDPGVLNLPYTPDVDVRDYVNIENVIVDYNLGPNGALIACSDIIAGKIQSIKDEIERLNVQLALVDTPGQMELFTYRSSGPFVVEALGRGQSMTLFLVDPTLSKKPSDFVSILLLSLSTQLRLHLPQVNLLTKTDLIEESEVDRIMDWVENPMALVDSIELQISGIDRELTKELYLAVDRIGFLPEMHTVSINDPDKIGNVYGVISRVLLGGSDELLRQS